MKITASLVEGLNQKRMEAELWYFNKTGQHECSAQALYPFLEKLQKIRFFEKVIKRLVWLNKIYRGDVSHPFFSSVVRRIKKWKPDVIHLHNLHGGWVDLKALALLSQHYPVIFTLHDEWILTGHCGSTLDCTGWQTGCTECPYLDRYVQIKRPITEKLRKEKERFLTMLADNHSVLVSPSNWLKERVVAAGVWKKKELVVVPNGIDLEPFKTLDKNKTALRKELNLPIDEKLVFFVADGGSQNSVKGFSDIRDMLNFQHGFARKFTLVVAGDAIAQREIININNVTVIKVGYLYREQLLKYYAAVDLFLYPTKADSFGLVIAEAMASALPIITTAVDAIPELVQHEVTGLLVRKNDPTMLFQAMTDFLNGKYDYDKMGQAARERIFECYGVTHMVNNYIELYQKTIDRYHVKN